MLSECQVPGRKLSITKAAVRGKCEGLWYLKTVREELHTVVVEYSTHRS